MIPMNRRTKIFISKDPTDMRSSYDLLFSKVKALFEEDLMFGHLFFLSIKGVPAANVCTATGLV